MGSLVLIIACPLIWPFIAKMLWSHEITPLELLANVFVGVMFGASFYFGGMYLQAADTEVLNGRVTSKTSDRVSCSHTYSCNCRQVCSGSGKERSCHESCDTCHEHSYDVDWNLHTEVGGIEIDRVDRRGIYEPARYTKAQVGDSVAVTHHYLNYIQAAPDSLFNQSTEKTLLERYAGKLPDYPRRVYDYHYVDRVLSIGVPVPDLAQWNSDLAKTLAAIGVRKQVNAVVVLTAEGSPDYAQALRAHWLGGKKNDVVIVIGAPAGPAIAWVTLFSWSDKELFKVELRDAIQAVGTLDRGQIIPLIGSHIDRSFVRKPMSDFEYLWHEADLAGWLVGLSMALALAVSVGLSIYFSRNQGYTYRPTSRSFFRR